MGEDMSHVNFCNICSCIVLILMLFFTTLIYIGKMGPEIDTLAHGNTENTCEPILYDALLTDIIAVPILIVGIMTYIYAIMSDNISMTTQLIGPFASVPYFVSCYLNFKTHSKYNADPSCRHDIYTTHNRAYSLFMLNFVMSCMNVVVLACMPFAAYYCIQTAKQYHEDKRRMLADIAARKQEREELAREQRDHPRQPKPSATIPSTRIPIAIPSAAREAERLPIATSALITQPVAVAQHAPITQTRLKYNSMTGLPIIEESRESDPYVPRRAAVAIPIARQEQSEQYGTIIKV